MRQSPGGKKGPRKLGDIQGSPPTSLTEMHPKEEEVMQKHPEACVNEQVVPGQT